MLHAPDPVKKTKYYSYTLNYMRYIKCRTWDLDTIFPFPSGRVTRIPCALDMRSGYPTPRHGTWIPSPSPGHETWIPYPLHGSWIPYPPGYGTWIPYPQILYLDTLPPTWELDTLPNWTWNLDTLPLTTDSSLQTCSFKDLSPHKY